MKNFFSQRSTRAHLAVVLLVLVASSSFGADVDLADNAALDYWRAAALMRQPRTVEEVEILQFVNRELAGLPPRGFGLRPAAARWLLEDRPLISIVTEAASKEVCQFPLSVEGSPIPDINHLTAMQQTSRRCLAAAKAYEYADNQEGAAEIYRSLLRMVEHLDQDESVASGLVAADILQSVTIALEGFLAREPERGASRILVEYFRKTKRPVLNLPRYLQAESGRFSRWLMQDPDLVERRLSQLYGNSPEKIAVDRLITLSPERREARLRGWVLDYETQMFRLAETVEKPFGLGLETIRELDAQKQAAAQELSAGMNPLIPLLVPTMEPVYGRFLLAEAQFSMTAILSYGSLYRAEFGRWPVNLEELSEWMHKPMPRDPFSGKEFFYKLIKLHPRIVTQIPKWMSGQVGLVYSLDVTRRRTRETKQLGRFKDDVDQQEEELREEIRRLEQAEGITVGTGLNAAVPLK